jgi:Mg-chelatase subunit ChlD
MKRSRHVVTSIALTLTLPLVVGACSRKSETASSTARGEEGEMGRSTASKSASDPAQGVAPAVAAPPAPMDDHASKGRSGEMGGIGAAKPGKAYGVVGPSASMDAPHAKRDEHAESDGRTARMAAADTQGVKAGEWDDNANYRDFSKWITQQQGFARSVDVSERRFVVVRDSEGKGIPGCKIVAKGERSSVSLMTYASGRALFFPHAQGLTGRKVSFEAQCPEGTVSETVSLDGSREVVELKIGKPRRAIATRQVDVAFVLDTTGSMSEEIAAVKATIQKVTQAFANSQTEIRFGLVEYKDRGDSPVTRAFPFTKNVNSFSASIAQLSASGGGDTPEDLNAGLRVAMSELQWNANAVARIAFVIADAPPHLDYANDNIDYTVSMKQAAERGIRIHSVSASGMDNVGQVVFRQMAQYTGGTNMFVMRGGAGPQSTGDALITKKIERELSLLNMNPMTIAGVGEDESAKACEKRFAWNQ